MPGPSDIRVNPFNNATNYVNLTERHIVPSVSPFVVRLNEVPEKQDPSNMQMFYVDDTTGQTTETALTEVAATPGAGEFRPDYSTNAFDDTSWNTGLIEFSSADAGKIIEVSYTATGTLAGVKTNRYPAWWLDRGDGSDGVFNPSGNVTISGEKNYTSVFIPEGVTVTVDGYVIIKCQGSFVNKGTITANGTGAKGGRYSNVLPGGIEPGEYGLAGSGGAGNQNPGYAGHYYNGAIVSENAVPAIINGLRGCAYGAGGGYGGGYNGGVGGNGGGAIAIVTKMFRNAGIISCDGSDGTSRTNTRGGGGGGGSVMIIALSIITSGQITANGGAGAANGSNGYTKIVELGAV